MRIFDAHNDLFTSFPDKFLNFQEDNVLVNYAVWGTNISQNSALKIANRIKKQGLVLSFEDISNINDFEAISALKPLWCSLTWNNDNHLGGGALGKNIGFTSKGKSLLKKLENCGIFLDSAHLSSKCLHYAIANFNGIIVNSHSCVYEICPHPRNVRINDIGRIINSGGFFGVCLHSLFLSDNAASASTVAKNIDAIVQRFGVRGVGIGTDFWGSTNIVEDLNNYQKFGNLAYSLQKLGYDEDSIDMILYRNMFDITTQRNQSCSKCE